MHFGPLELRWTHLSRRRGGLATDIGHVGAAQIVPRCSCVVQGLTWPNTKGVATGRQGVATGRIDGSWILFKLAWWSVAAQACTFDTTPDRQTFVPTHANEDKTPQCARILRRHHSPFPCPSEVADLYRRRDGCGTRAGFLRKSFRQYFCRF